MDKTELATYSVDKLKAFVKENGITWEEAEVSWETEDLLPFIGNRKIENIISYLDDSWTELEDNLTEEFTSIFVEYVEPEETDFTSFFYPLPNSASFVRVAILFKE